MIDPWEQAERDRESIIQWMEAQHRVKWQAKNEKGRAALEGEFMVFNVNREPLLRSYIEAYCRLINQEWKAGYNA